MPSATTPTLVDCWPGRPTVTGSGLKHVGQQLLFNRGHSKNKLNHQKLHVLSKTLSQFQTFDAAYHHRIAKPNIVNDFPAKEAAGVPSDRWKPTGPRRETASLTDSCQCPPPCLPQQQAEGHACSPPTTGTRQQGQTQWCCRQVPVPIPEHSPTESARSPAALHLGQLVSCACPLAFPAAGYPAGRPAALCICKLVCLLCLLCAHSSVYPSRNSTKNNSSAP